MSRLKFCASRASRKQTWWLWARSRGGARGIESASSDKCCRKRHAPYWQCQLPKRSSRNTTRGDRRREDKPLSPSRLNAGPDELAAEIATVVAQRARQARSLTIGSVREL